MRRLLWALLIGLVPIMVPLLVPFLAHAADRPDWAFPVTDKVQPPARSDDQPHTVPGSDKSYTRKQIDDLFNPPDWYPDMHPPMPKIVAHGEATAVRACASCHLPTGTGHDESAYIAALPVSYFVRQMIDYKSGDRKGSGSMTAIAKAISDDDVRAAADYFAALKPRPWIRVVETDMVPKTYVGPGNKRLRLPDGGNEPIGSRIIEIPEDEEVVLNRDPRSGFIAFVPMGSIAKGETLVRGGGDKTVPCAICHGPNLHGLGEVPPIAGRQATYVVRQLFAIQDGSRGGISSALMQQVVEKLTLDDMLAIAAYTASRGP
jgi:cytochrome c553